MIIREMVEKHKKSIAHRLSNSSAMDRGRPMMAPSNIYYEMSEKTRGMLYGGIGAIHQLVDRMGLAEAIDRRPPVTFAAGLASPISEP